MEKRKEKEIQHYDKATIGFDREGDFEGFNPSFLASHKFLKKILKGKAGSFLDYGCGAGIHSWWLKEIADDLVGIDLSRKSLEIARQNVKGVRFLLMDCENMGFENNSFDVIFDGGTFSSLELEKALSEIARVLKSEGFLVGIETLGHNPILNLKRKINRIRGKRTAWAEEHIFRMEDLETVKKYFDKTELYFFHLFSWIAFPFLNLPGGKTFLRMMEKMDRFFLKICPFLKKYSFKLVFIFSEPKK